ncbi:hypothetical protein [Streptomyces sp. NPDC048623]|uniref:hypothetical protein n=1 Tax=Streptomyces sp. NPDC048623 TaxID=3155761 RepID=UPI003428FF3B
MAFILAGLVGCQSGGAASGDGTALSVNRLAQLADEVGEDGSDNCPLPYDVKKAAGAVGLGKEIEPGAPDDALGAVVATAENGTQPEKESAWAANPGALVSCMYHSGEDALKIHTIGGEKPGVVSLLAPVMQRDGGMNTTELGPYVEKTKKAAPGEAVQSEGGNVVTVPLSAGDTGNVAIVLTVGNMGKTSLTPEQILELAKTFAGQTK